jgi:hypothetical protein
MSELHQEGRFRGRAIEGAWGRSLGGTEQVAVMFHVLDTDAKLTWYGFLTEKTSERTMNSLLACGVSDLESLEGLGSDEVELVIEHEEYNGKTRAKIQWVNRLGTGGVAMKNKAEGSDLKSMLKKHQGNFLKLKKEQGAIEKQPEEKVRTTGSAPF